MNNTRERFLQVFGTDKPIIGMLHLLGSDRDEVLKIAREETELMLAAGVTAVLVENYFGSSYDAEAVLQMLQKDYPGCIRGVNILGNSLRKSWELAEKYGAKFIQVDSICGHLKPETENRYFQIADELKNKGDILILGGVRFKYQPVNSGRTLEEDLAIGRNHCDAIVVTGEGTGIETDIEKIRTFREYLGDFPLVVGAGMTAENCAAQLALSDGGIVGSYFKQSGFAHNRMDKERVETFMAACRQ